MPPNHPQATPLRFRVVSPRLNRRSSHRVCPAQFLLHNPVPCHHNSLPSPQAATLHQLRPVSRRVTRVLYLHVILLRDLHKSPPVIPLVALAVIRLASRLHFLLLYQVYARLPFLRVPPP